jgi:hypothetical protein
MRALVNFSDPFSAASALPTASWWHTATCYGSISPARIYSGYDYWSIECDSGLPREHLTRVTLYSTCSHLPRLGFNFCSPSTSSSAILISDKYMTDNYRGGKVTSLLVMEMRLKRRHPTIVKCLLVHYSAACLIFVCSSAIWRCTVGLITC